MVQQCDAWTVKMKIRLSNPSLHVHTLTNTKCSHAQRDQRSLDLQSQVQVAHKSTTLHTGIKEEQTANPKFWLQSVFRIVHKHSTHLGTDEKVKHIILFNSVYYSPRLIVVTVTQNKKKRQLLIYIYIQWLLVARYINMTYT